MNISRFYSVQFSGSGMEAPEGMKSLLSRVATLFGIGQTRSGWEEVGHWGQEPYNQK